MGIDRPRRFSDGRPPESPVLQALAAPRPRPPTLPPSHLRVLSLNIQVNGENGRLPGIIALIRQSGADIIGLQECSPEVGAQIARELGYNVLQSTGGPVLSRLPIEPPPPGRGGVTVTLPNGRRVLFVNLHLNHHPYGPFQVHHIPYENGRFVDTERDAVFDAEANHGPEVRRAIQELNERAGDMPAIVVGDFNQPSHLDWTDAAVRIRRHRLRVRWPESLAFANAGFTDAYRRLFPDEIAHPGYTWSPGVSPTDPTNHLDRIDFVLYRGQNVLPTRARIIGESAATSDIVVRPYPTDHRGVLVDFTIPAQAGVEAALGH